MPCNRRAWNDMRGHVRNTHDRPYCPRTITARQLIGRRALSRPSRHGGASKVALQPVTYNSFDDSSVT
ncbi:unnamed protein product, partial [Nesidiocoris tenuis]